MAYNDTPLAAQAKNASQPLIRQNFQILQAYLQVNHETLSGVAGQGKHIKTELLNSAAHPLVAATDVTLYNFLNATTGLQELYVKRTGAGGIPGVPMTASLNAVNGWTYLPSGLLMKWGTSAANGNTNVAYAGPAFTTVLTAQVSPLFAAAGDADCAVRIISYANPAQLNVYLSHRFNAGSANASFTYLAIGF
jgi:hypothetical protein